VPDEHTHTCKTLVALRIETQFQQMRTEACFFIEVYPSEHKLSL